MQYFWITVSKAFDFVSFNCLLRELFAVGVRGNLLSWFRSYLTDRWHRTVIDGQSSTWQPVLSGIPQGSILGPWLFIIYMSYFAVSCTPGVGSWPSFILIVHLSTNIARDYELSFHFYADHTQLYLTSEKSSLNDMELCKCRLEECVREIDTQMLLNKLKLNKDKAELLAISSLHRTRPPLSHIYVCDERVLASPRARNIGVLFDESLSMVPQVTAMCKSVFYRLRKIRLIRKHLTFDAAQLLVRALT